MMPCIFCVLVTFSKYFTVWFALPQTLVADIDYKGSVIVVGGDL